MSTSEENEVQSVMDEDALLDHTQQVRMKLVKEMTTVQMPTDKGERMVLLAALEGIDKQALAKKKIGSDEKRGAEDRRVAVMISQMSRKLGADSPFEIPVPLPHGRTMPILEGPGLEPLVVVPGETAQGIEMETCENFMARMENGGTLTMTPGSDEPSM